MGEISHINEAGTKINLKNRVEVLQGEIIDGTCLSVNALLKFLEQEIQDAKSKGLLFSLHMKATMMKVSDPIIFGHAVRVFFKPVFDEYHETFERIGVDVNNGFGDLVSKLSLLTESERSEIEKAIIEVLSSTTRFGDG